MTDLRNPGILRVSEARYRAINRFNGIFALVIGVIAFAGALAGLRLGPDFVSFAIALTLLGVGAIGVGVVTLIIIARFPHVDRFGRLVTWATVVPVVLGLVGAAIVALTATDASILFIAAMVVVLTVMVAVLANANRLVLRTGAALIAPPAT